MSKGMKGDENRPEIFTRLSEDTRKNGKGECEGIESGLSQEILVVGVWDLRRS